MQENFNSLREQLTETDIDQIMSIVSHRCRIKTVNRLHSILKYGPRSVPQYGIFNRLIKDPKHGWEYMAGQDYTSEVKTLRDCILGRV